MDYKNIVQEHISYNTYSDFTKANTYLTMLTPIINT